MGIGLLLIAKNWVVKVAKAEIRGKPDFLSSTVSQVKKGERVKSIKEENQGWLLVEFHNGRKGYLHRSAVEGAGSLSGLIPGEKGARDEEVALAAKGFNEQVERKVKESPGYNFRDLDWVLNRSIGSEKVRQFVTEGKLR